MPRARVESTASFYSFLHTRPAGEFRILFSDNITDRMLGNQALMQTLCDKLWLQPGKVSEDGLARVSTTSCTGMCDQGPALLANGRTDLDHHQMPDPVGKAIGCLLERIAELESEVARIAGQPANASGSACRECDDTCSQPTFANLGHGAK